MRLFKHKDVDDYFDSVDASALDAEQCRGIAQAYEDGRAILLRGLRPDFDQDFFARLQWLEDDSLKKLKSTAVIAHHQAVLRKKIPATVVGAAKNSAADQYMRLRQTVFNGDEGKLGYFIEQVDQVNRFLTDTARKIFPTYRYTSEPMTWRLSETLNENVHIDVYNVDLPDHHVRMFVNLDDAHRIWHTSHRLETLLDRHLKDLDPEFVATATPGRICHALNFKVFGGFETAGREGAAKHICFFEPGEVWLVDSRKVSHQIFYGRRAVSTDFQVDPASMLDPSKHYYALVEARRARLGRQIA